GRHRRVVALKLRVYSRDRRRARRAVNLLKDHVIRHAILRNDVANRDQVNSFRRASSRSRRHLIMTHSPIGTPMSTVKYAALVSTILPVRKPTTASTKPSADATISKEHRKKARLSI